MSVQHTPLPLLSEKESSASQERTNPRSPPGSPTTISFSFTSVITPQSFIPGEIFCKMMQMMTKTFKKNYPTVIDTIRKFIIIYDQGYLQQILIFSKSVPLLPYWILWIH